MRRKKRKQAAQASRQPKETPDRPRVAWSMGFMSDSLAHGRSLRLLNVADECSRECVGMVVDSLLPAERDVRELDQLVEVHGKPRWITTDNGPEFTSQRLDEWAYRRGIELRFIRPGKPVENCLVESCNGRVRDECLKQHCFLSLDDARAIIEDWRQDYNEVRPHSSLAGLMPSEYGATLGAGYLAPNPGQADACQTTESNPLDTAKT